MYSWTILSTTNSGHYRAGTWNDLRVRVETNKLLCYVNDQLVIESGDAALQDGRVGLAKFRQTKAEFREFRVGAKLDPRPAAAPQLDRLLSATGDLQEDALRPLLKTNAGNVSRALTEEASRLEQRASRMREMAKNAVYEATQHELVQVMTAPDSEINLFHAALLISKLDNPELDVRAYREQLDALATELKASMSATATNDERVRRVIEFLFAESGFHGSRSDYYHRANSYIDRVMDDREGLPITLSVLFLELAQRVGVKHVSAAALPGRFMVLYNPAPGKERWIDVFDGGRLLNRAEVASVLRENNEAEVETDYLTAATKKEIVIRMLRNLANVAERNQDPRESLRYLDAVVALAPAAPLERLGRAMARIGAGDVRGAREDLRVVIESEPEGVDVRRVEDLYRRLERAGE